MKLVQVSGDHDYYIVIKFLYMKGKLGTFESKKKKTTKIILGSRISALLRCSHEILLGFCSVAKLEKWGYLILFCINVI